MSLLSRIILSIIIVSLAAFAVASAVLLQDMEGRLSRMENITSGRLNTTSAQLAAQSVALSDLADQLNLNREQLSLEAINLRREIETETASLKAQTEGLRGATLDLESSLSEETQARIDTNKNIHSQILSIQDNGSEIILDLEQLLKSVVLVACEISPGNFSQGSGTIIDASGRIVTNAHVIDPNKTLPPNSERLCVIGVTESEVEAPVYKYTAAIQSIDHDDDMSFLQVSGGVNGHTPPAVFTFLPYPTCSTRTMNLNDELYTIGYPQIGQSTFTITNGIVSGFLDGHIKTSAKIDQGNSGGAAINVYGELIGIPTYGVVGEIDSLGYVINLRKHTCNNSV